MAISVAPQSSLIAVEDLVVEFHTEGGVVRAGNGVSCAIPRSGTLALIGESGCGKSVTSLALLNLVRPPGRIAGGTITYTGADGTARQTTDWKPGSEQMRRFRGADVAMIFQEPMPSFDPLFTVGEQIIETVQTF